jgi:hypothetical protein
MAGLTKTRLFFCLRRSGLFCLKPYGKVVRPTKELSTALIAEPHWVRAHAKYRCDLLHMDRIAAMQVIEAEVAAALLEVHAPNFGIEIARFRSSADELSPLTHQLRILTLHA